MMSLETRDKSWRWRFLFAACAPSRSSIEMREIASYAVPELDLDTVVGVLQSAIDDQSIYAVGSAIDELIELRDAAVAEAAAEQERRGL